MKANETMTEEEIAEAEEEMRALRADVRELLGKLIIDLHKRNVDPLSMCMLGVLFDRSNQVAFPEEHRDGVGILNCDDSH